MPITTVALDKATVLKVTQEDIKRGVRGDPCKCPIARAFQRQQGVLGYVLPSWIKGPAGYWKFLDQEGAKRFVENFDNGCWPRPTNFEIEREVQPNGD